MPSPSTALTTHRPDLGASMEEFDLAMDREHYIGMRAAPVIESAKSAGRYGKIPIEELLQVADTARAPGTSYATGDWTFTDVAFATVEHGWVEPCDDREADMYRDFFDAELICAGRAIHMVMRNFEKRIADMLFNATTFTATAITNEWDDGPNATPIIDVEASVQRVYAASGLWPNTLIINRKVFRNLRKVDEIRDLVKQQNFQDVRASELGPMELARVFDLAQVLVAGGTDNTALEPTAASLSPIWSDEYAMVCYVPVTDSMREPAIARTIHWSEDGSRIGGTVEQYRSEDRRSEMFRARFDTDELTPYVEAGDLLSNITT